MSAQEQARAMLKDASTRMAQAEWAEAEAAAKLATVLVTATLQEIDELIAEANCAHVSRVQAQLHYANCRQHLRTAWETRGEEFPRPFSVVEAEGK